MQFESFIDLWNVSTSTFLVLLFIRALLHKASDLARFTGFLSNYDLLPQASLKAFTYVLIFIEALTVVSLLFSQFTQIGAAFAIGILLTYAAVIALNVYKGNLEIECGCGGPAMYLSYGLVWRNLAIATMALPLFLIARQPISFTDTAVAIACGAVLYLLYVAIEQLMANFNQFYLKAYFP
jgi:hypothetical protein